MGKKLNQLYADSCAGLVDDEQLFAAVLAYAKRSVRRLSRESNEQHDDLVADICLRVWKNRDSFSGKSGFATWVARIGEHAWYDFIKDKASRRNREVVFNSVVVDETEFDDVTTQSSHLSMEPTILPSVSEREMDVRRWVLGLSNEDSTLLALRMEGHSWLKIARLLKSPVGTLTCRFHRLKQQWLRLCATPNRT